MYARRVGRVQQVTREAIEGALKTQFLGYEDSAAPIWIMGIEEGGAPLWGNRNFKCPARDTLAKRVRERLRTWGVPMDCRRE
jgi:hypothetical protein